MRRFEHFTDRELIDIRTGLLIWQTTYSNQLQRNDYPDEMRDSTMKFVERLQKLIDEIRTEFTWRMP